MNKTIKRILLGLIVWGLPFIASFFVWDIVKGGPSVSYPWFYAWIGVAAALGFGIAAYYNFKGFKEGEKVRNGDMPKVCREGQITAVTWYIEALVLDAIFLMGLFGMSFAEYKHLFVTYLSIPILTMMAAKLKK